MELESMYGQFDFAGLEKKLDQLFPNLNIGLEEIISSILSGNFFEIVKRYITLLLNSLFDEVTGLKGAFITLILFGILSAVLHNLMELSEGKHLAVYGFYYNYLIMIIFLIKIAAEVFSISREILQNMILFMKMFIPTYFMTVAAAGGSVSAMGFYQIFIAVIYAIEVILSGIMIPAISAYMLVCVMNGLWEEEKLNLIINLLKKGIRGSLKVLLTLVTGSGMIQSMITPVIDSTKMSILQKSVGMLPGVGDLAGGASQALLGCAVLIKNAAGITMVLLLLLLCALPMLKLFLITALLKISAAVMGMIADKRITNCTNRMGDGILMLFQTVLCAVTFFVILISIVAFTTNRGI